jgi:class 3 adenylate cyclase
VNFLTYWFDQASGTGFCLVDAPDKETAQRVHEESHGNVATDIVAVELSAVEASLGRIADHKKLAGESAPDIDSAFRAVMFTDLVDSTGMTARLGDARSVEMVRAHDSFVRRALSGGGGREVKHTSDGIMASFDDADSAVKGTCTMQRSFESFNRDSNEELHVRIGIHAGEPIQDSNDLFGATVQMAARICDFAAADAIVDGWGDFRRRGLERSLAKVTAVEVNDALASTCAELRAACRAAGLPPSQKIHDADRWIAAPAVHRGLGLVSDDSVFENTPGLLLLPTR